MNVTSQHGVPITDVASHDGHWSSVRANYEQSNENDQTMLRMDVAPVIPSSPDNPSDSNTMPGSFPTNFFTGAFTADPFADPVFPTGAAASPPTATAATVNVNTNADSAKAPSSLLNRLSRVSSTSNKSNRDSMISSSDSCCTVDEGKKEMKALMSSFLTDFKKVYGETFAEEMLSSSDGEEFVTAKTGDENDTEVTTPKPVSSELPSPTDNQEGLHPNIWCDWCGEVSAY